MFFGLFDFSWCSGKKRCKHCGVPYYYYYNDNHRARKSCRRYVEDEIVMGYHQFK